MVEQHLQTVSEKLRRRRMALLRDTSPGGRLGDTAFFTLGRAPAGGRRLDEVDLRSEARLGKVTSPAHGLAPRFLARWPSRRHRLFHTGPRSCRRPEIGRGRLHVRFAGKPDRKSVV